MTDRVKVFKDAQGQWRWHRQSENGRIVADSSEGYRNKTDCVDMALDINPGCEFTSEQ